jgi:hypothetical protein
LSTNRPKPGGGGDACCGVLSASASRSLAGGCGGFCGLVAVFGMMIWTPMLGVADKVKTFNDDA